jgi:N-methylhydantoinase A/oxoprolinase/acetone carboxylase beta subunit
MDIAPEAFCERVVADVSNRVARELVSKVLSDEVTTPDWAEEPSATALLDRALGNVAGSDLNCQLKLRQPLVAVGAPVEAYLPRVAQRLHTELVIPNRAEVGNAVGAVAGGVVQQLHATIRPFDGDQYFRLLMPDGVRDFDTLEEAVAHAQQVVPERLRALSQQAGADQVEVQMERVDRRAPVRMGWGEEIYLGTDLTFTAAGRPSPARSV